MYRLTLRRRRTRPLGPTCSAMLLALVLGGCGSNGSDPDPDPTPGATLEVAPASATIAAGASGSVTATVTRTGGFTGALTIAATGAPAGVTVTGGTIAAGSTTQTVTIAAAGTAAAYSGNLSITATATGITVSPATLALTVTASGATGQIGSGIEGEAAYDQASEVALSANGSRVLIGARGSDATGNNAGHARVFERSGNSWVQVGGDIDGEAAGDYYGESVAISDNGSRIAIGSYDNDGGGAGSGHVRVYDLAGGAWTQVGADIDGEAGRGSGWAVRMNASGSRVVIGGPGNGSANGQVKVYEFAGGSWTQVGGTLALNREFGHAVAMSDNGNRIAVSYPSASGSSLPGTVAVYDWNGTSWVGVGTPIDGEAISDYLGTAVALNGDGTVLAVGATGNDAGAESSGHVRVFRLTGGAWTQVGADIDGVTSGDLFGSSVDLSADGNRVAAAGMTVAVYDLTGGSWVKLTGIDFGALRRMESIAISADGRTVATGELNFAGAAGSATGITRLYALP